MTVLEMHHAVEQGLQKVASNSFDTFLPEEIDFALNKMQERFVKQRFFFASDPKRQGLHGSQKRVDDLRVLTVLDYLDTVVTPNPARNYEDFDLPTDYMFLINSRVNILYDDCKIDPELVSNGTFSTTSDWTLGDGTDDRWAISNSQLKHTAGSGSSYQEAASQILEEVRTGETYLITFILQRPSSSPGYNGSFTVSLGSPITGGLNTSLTFNYDASAVSAGSATIYQSTSLDSSGNNTIEKQIELQALSDQAAITFTPSQDFDGVLKNVSVKRIKEIGLRIVEPDDAYNILGNPFATATDQSAFGIVNGTNIKVFRNTKNNKSYLLKSLRADYIRTPVEISLSSNVDCELADHTHQEIVDLTVKHLLEATESQRYQTNTVESSQTE